MKLKIIFLVTLVMVLAAACVKVDTGYSVGLSAQDVSFLEINEGKWKYADNIFTRGDRIGLTLIEVGPFSQDEQGFNHMELDLILWDNQGEEVLRKEAILGEKGRVQFPNNIAPSPLGYIDTLPETPAGDYKLQMIVYDKLNGKKVSKSMHFVLE